MTGILSKITYPCEKIRDMLMDHLEESLPTFASIRFHLHLNGCKPCREYLFLYKKAAHAKAFRIENPLPKEFLTQTLESLGNRGMTHSNKSP